MTVVVGNEVVNVVRPSPGPDAMLELEPGLDVGPGLEPGELLAGVFVPVVSGVSGVVLDGEPAAGSMVEGIELLGGLLVFQLLFKSSSPSGRRAWWPSRRASTAVVNEEADMTPRMGFGYKREQRE